MQIKTWLQRLTDESNLWFNAVKAEDEGDLDQAATFYIKDAAQCLKKHSLVRAALSCSCTAGCLAKMGAWHYARELYVEAAGMYVENASAEMHHSIRETLWSLGEAYENFVLAGDEVAAEAVRSKYMTLATRINPFLGSKQAASELESRRVAAEEVAVKPPSKEMLTTTATTTTTATMTATGKSLSRELATEIERFMQVRKSQSKADGFDPKYVLKAIDTSGGHDRLDEKSIAS